MNEEDKIKKEITSLKIKDGQKEFRELFNEPITKRSKNTTDYRPPTTLQEQIDKLKISVDFLTNKSHIFREHTNLNKKELRDYISKEIDNKTIHILNNIKSKISDEIIKEINYSLSKDGVKSYIYRQVKETTKDISKDIIKQVVNKVFDSMIKKYYHEQQIIFSIISSTEREINHLVQRLPITNDLSKQIENIIKNQTENITKKMITNESEL